MNKLVTHTLLSFILIPSYAKSDWIEALDALNTLIILDPISWVEEPDNKSLVQCKHPDKSLLKLTPSECEKTGGLIIGKD